MQPVAPSIRRERRSAEEVPKLDTPRPSGAIEIWCINFRPVNASATHFEIGRIN